MPSKIGRGKSSEPTRVDFDPKRSVSSEGLAARKDRIEQREPAKTSSKGCWEWLVSQFLRFCACIRSLFTSSEELSHNEIDEMKEEKKPVLRTTDTNQEHVNIVRQSTNDFNQASLHFKQITDQRVQLLLIKELMKNDQATPEFINGLVNNYEGKQEIYDQMKHELEENDLSFLTDQTTMSKGTYLQMGNEQLFRRFPKSTLANIVVSALIQKKG